MKIAGVQLDIAIGQPRRNVDRMIEKLRETAIAGAKLTVFPECAVPGYCFGSLEEARDYAEPILGDTTERMVQACKETGGYCVYGMLEADGQRVFNAAVLVGPQGMIGAYRKVHLPYLGVDMYTTPGDRPFAVHEAGGVRIGMNICYDAAFPEAARTLAILGADLIVLPTNWPPGAECTACSVISARALENAVYYIAVNRVGEERGFRFIGRSSICDTNGETLAVSTTTDEEILYAEIDPARARRKHIIRVPGKHEIDRLADRRPEMYGELVKPHNLKRPGRA
jgi:predicted amidohydrolase